jgi:hypothetical protein
MDTNRLTGNEHKDDFLVEMGFSSVEIAKVQALRSRPRGQGQRNDRFVIPKLFSDYNSFHKSCYADVFGDAAAEVIFGRGPWLAKERRIADALHRKGKSLDSLPQANHKRRSDCANLQLPRDSGLHPSDKGEEKCL